MRYLIFDTETTGTDPDHDQIIEGAWLEIPPSVSEFMAVKNPNKFPSYCERFQPTVSISYGAMATHNILGEDLVGKLSSKLFELPAGDLTVIGHKVDFDIDMVYGSTEHCPYNPEIRICTLALSRWLFPELDSHRQEAMLYYIGHLIERPGWARELLKNAHAALDDVNACAILLRFLIKTMANRGFDVDTWEKVAALSEEARIPLKISFGKHEGSLIADIPSGYCKWYAGQDKTDPYLITAMKKAGKL